MLATADVVLQSTSFYPALQVMAEARADLQSVPN